MKSRTAMLKVLALLVLAPLTGCAVRPRPVLKPQTDAINHYYSDNVEGKWVKGCDNCDHDSCNMGVGNLGEKCTYHWEKDK